MDSFTVAAAVFYAIICIHTAGAVKLKRRVGELESDVIILKLQHKDTIKSIGRNAEFISQLNETVSALDKCKVPVNNRNSGCKEIKKDGHDERGRNLNFFRAFKEEKNQRRIYENQINKALDEHKKEMKTAALDDKTHIEKTMNNFSAVLDQLKVDLNFSLNKTTTDDIESLVYIDNLESIVMKLKQDISSIEIKHKQDMDSFKKSIEMKHKQDIESLTAELTDLKTIVNEISHNIAPYVDQWKRCRDGGTRSGDFLYKYFSDTETYAGARQACVVCGGHIADIQDEDEMAFVKGLTAKGFWLWLGATDTATEGTWVWDRTGEEAIYTDWNPGEPNNVRQSDGATEQCLVAGWVSSNMKWRDTRCDHNTYRYVCKYYLA